MKLRRKTDILKGSILVIDNELDWIADFKKQLASIGSFNIQIVESAEEGLTYCKNRCFDIIIFGLALPNMNGVEFAEKVQTLQEHSSLFLFSNIDIALDEEILLREIGVDEIINKNKGNELLITIIKRVLSRRLIAYYDDMTQVLTRTMFSHIINVELSKIKKKPNYNLAVINIDCNKFKYVNDTFGHATGDKVLIYTVNLIKNNLRKNDLIFRMGGDEFNIIMPNTNADEAIKVMKRVCNIIKESKILIKTIGKSFSISVGIIESGGDDSEFSLKQKSDIAMFSAKRKNIDIVCRRRNANDYEEC